MPKNVDYKKLINKAIDDLKNDAALKEALAVAAMDIKKAGSREALNISETVYLIGYLKGKGVDIDEVNEALTKILGKKYVN